MKDKIDYSAIIKKYPWVVEREQNCIISPDSDGLLCGLLMSYYLGWNVVGFYDGKNLLIKKQFSTKEVVFLDMEILRKNIKSVGHHLNIHDLNNPPDNYNELMSNCINPNEIRKFDRLHSKLTRKYPLGAIHLLMYILEFKYPKLIKIKKEGLAPVFFADGVWKILFKYTNNVLNWFDYLHSGIEADWWLKLKNLSVIDLIKEIDDLLEDFKKIEPDNKNWYGHIDLSQFSKQKSLLFQVLKLFSKQTGWKFNERNWNIDDLKNYNFSKTIYGQNNSGSTGNGMFLKIWAKNPISLAMTDGSTVQYTEEKPDKLP